MRTITATVALMAGCMVAAGCAGAPAATTSTAQSPQTPAAVSPVTTSPTKAPEPVKPVGHTINPHKVQWQKAVAKGRDVKLTWWSGVAPCTVLDHVKVTETARRVTLTIYEGAKSKDVSCIMIAIQKTTIVKLKSPLGHRKLVDGAK
ncbi:hypothetical protein [Nonomuraea sediminis]|uniref:hypothetical protein n=1 Tax=Nonomuraea sediminis TaxID=2835864 RepID=UPI00202A494C|nr:hypothetical protein [Nonomuraea sediminis]